MKKFLIILSFALLSCADPDERLDVGYSDGYAVGFNTTCIIRATLVEGDWKNKDWWIETVAWIREENDDKILASAAVIIDLAQARTIEAMPEATAAQASIIGATWVDKGRLIRNQATVIRGDSDTVKSLAAEFKALSRDHKNISDSVVSTQDATRSATQDKQ